MPIRKRVLEIPCIRIRTSATSPNDLLSGTSASPCKAGRSTTCRSWPGDEARTPSSRPIPAACRGSACIPVSRCSGAAPRDRGARSRSSRPAWSGSMVMILDAVVAETSRLLRDDVAWRAMQAACRRIGDVMPPRASPNNRSDNGSPPEASAHPAAYLYAFPAASGDFQAPALVISPDARASRRAARRARARTDVVDPSGFDRRAARRGVVHRRCPGTSRRRSTSTPPAHHRRPPGGERRSGRHDARPGRFEPQLESDACIATDLGPLFHVNSDSTSQWLPPARSCVGCPRCGPIVLTARTFAGVLQLALSTRAGYAMIADLGILRAGRLSPVRW